MRNLTALEIHVHADFGYGRHNPRVRWKKHEDTGSVSEISKEIHMRDDRQLSGSPPSEGLTSTVLGEPSSRFIGPRNNPQKESPMHDNRGTMREEKVRPSGEGGGRGTRGRKGKGGERSRNNSPMESIGDSGRCPTRCYAGRAHCTRLERGEE